MAKTPIPEKPAPIWGFYRPHPRVAFDGSLTNPITGEIYYPPARTKQEFVKQCDINNIIKEFSITGQWSHVSAKAAQGAFVDLPEAYDFQSSMNTVIHAQEAFMALPAKVRDRFHNEPGEFLAFVSDPANADELVKLGIRNPPPRPPAAPPAAAAPTTPPGGSESTPPAATKE